MERVAASVGMGLLFYPRGGSAQVARYLSRALERHGWPVTLCCGSLGAGGSVAEAAVVFAGIDIVPATYDDAVARWQRGEDPMNAPFPMHPSYEDRPGVPDRAFARVTPAQGARITAAWTRHIASSARMRRSSVLHLHHLTPIHDAVASALPGVPVITHLHGTELKMLEAFELRPPSAVDGPYAGWWAERMRAGARRAVATITISPFERDRAVRLLGLDPATVHCVPNGVDVERFARRLPTRPERRERWRRWLVHDPQGWDEATSLPGSVRYTEREVDEAFFAVDGSPRPVLLFVGRFLSFKRVTLLLRAYARARRAMADPAPLVIWGGMPGEWEGDHPHSIVIREGIDDVFFVGWRDHDELPQGLACADCFVAPSTDEPFGLVYLEAMACDLPVIGTTSGGPPSFVNVVPGEPDGWLVAPDDEVALAAAIVSAVTDADDRRQRGSNAGRHVRAAHSWDIVAERVAALYARSTTPADRGRARRSTPDLAAPGGPPSSRQVRAPE